MNSLGFVDLIKSFICALSVFNISLGVPDHEIVCLSIKITLSATLHTDAISWVIVIALPPTVLTADLINLSIKLPVTGSKPDVGSSNNSTFGFPHIALAIAILYCIPPEISEG